MMEIHHKFLELVVMFGSLPPQQTHTYRILFGLASFLFQEQVRVGQRHSTSKLVCTLVVAAERGRQGSFSTLVYWMAPTC